MKKTPKPEKVEKAQPPQPPPPSPAPQEPSPAAVPDAVTRVAEFCQTDLAHLQFARAMLELQGRFSSKHMAEQSLLYVDPRASELVLQDVELGHPGWVLETRVPCQVASSRNWATPAVALFQEMLRSPVPQDLASVVLSLRNRKALAGAPAGQSWLVEGPIESPPKSAPAPGAEAPISSALLHKLIEATAPSVSLDETRAHLSQMILELEKDRARSVSTDGHRLTVTEMGASIPAEICGTYKLPFRVMRLVQFLLKWSPTVLFGAMKNGRWSLRAGPHFLSISPAEADFPPYRNVIPGSDDRGPRLLVETRKLVAALKHFDKIRRALREPENQGITLDISPQQVLFSREQSRQVVPCLDCIWGWVQPSSDKKKKSSTSPAGEQASEMSASLNLQYLLSAAKQIGSDLTWLEFGSPLDPIVLRPTDSGSGLIAGCSTFVVVMPMRT